MIHLRNLCKSYREGTQLREVLKYASLELKEGSFAALLGRSGSGKSTLLNLLAGLDRPDSGEIWCGQRLLSALDEREFTLFRRRHVGFVFQFFHLFPTLTVLENLELILELAGSNQHQRCQSLLERVGLWERRNSYPDRLSGGEQQRVAVARALVHEPELLLADEPTGNLDAENGRTVLQLLVDMSREQHVTLLVATHSPEVGAAADVILRIANGAIEQEGQ